MAAKKISPAVTPESEGRERALVQNQGGLGSANALPFRGLGKDTSRPAIFPGASGDKKVERISLREMERMEDEKYDL